MGMCLGVEKAVSYAVKFLFGYSNSCCDEDMCQMRKRIGKFFSKATAFVLVPATREYRKNFDFSLLCDENQYIIRTHS